MLDEQIEEQINDSVENILTKIANTSIESLLDDLELLSSEYGGTIPESVLAHLLIDIAYDPMNYY